jgi:hypothetical protein
MGSCSANDTNCNWAPTFFAIKTDNETFCSNTTRQFHVQRDAGPLGARRDVIALFTGIPANVTRCTMAWYKPEKGIFYGTFGDGSINISSLDTGDKSFFEAVGSTDVNFGNTKALIAEEINHSILDLGNWGTSIGAARLSNGIVFDCAGPELAVHFAMSAPWEGAVVVDQVSELAMNRYVQRAGWHLEYKE